MKIREFRWLLKSTESLDFFFALSAFCFGFVVLILIGLGVLNEAKVSQNLLLTSSGFLGLVKLFWPARPTWLTTLLVKGLICISFTLVCANGMVSMSEIQIFYIFYAVGSFVSLMRT